MFRLLLDLTFELLLLLPNVSSSVPSCGRCLKIDIIPETGRNDWDEKLRAARDEGPGVKQTALSRLRARQGRQLCNSFSGHAWLDRQRKGSISKSLIIRARL